MRTKTRHLADLDGHPIKLGEGSVGFVGRVAAARRVRKGVGGLARDMRGRYSFPACPTEN